MSQARAHLLMHPVRMRIVLALFSEALTTKELSEVLPDVPQASLYRAVGELKNAGILEIVSEERRGGAIERTYRAIQGSALMSHEEFTSGQPEEFMAAIQAFADQIVATTSRYVGTSENNSWRQGKFTFRHASMWLTDQEREDMRAELSQVLAKYESRERGPESTSYSVNVAVSPTAARRSTDSHSAT
ncbi:helix-turn-helix domain-containing protein [Demequina sp. B12]|uniref:helix-turn-helix domain-containing protein n=1 Tax=Demequina sp. B12 TaxID=2992757 RepID=UPI00237B7487|nr:helix-turn-helix domain-containing protein [Demequina sp. B12]MDE0573449.1 helix-turn-helix domain-containing protein [Demequina sp. B12]